MRNRNSAAPSLTEPAPASLAELAEQLLDGPLQNLIKLQRQAIELADRLADNPAGQIEDLETLVRLSLSTMEQFHTFTHEFAALLRDLTDVQRQAN